LQRVTKIPAIHTAKHNHNLHDYRYQNEGEPDDSSDPLQVARFGPISCPQDKSDWEQGKELEKEDCLKYRAPGGAEHREKKEGDKSQSRG
jgi:hypothetical protein